MQRLTLSVSALALAIGFATAIFAEEQSTDRLPIAQDNDNAQKGASASDIRRWIDQLGDESFSARSTAAEQLMAAGESAREPLSEAARSFDPEVRAAARRLTVLIARAEFNNRLAAFAADTDGKRGTTLPGWKQFRALVGNDPAARELFVDMQRQEGAVIAQVFSAPSPARASESVEALERLERRANQSVFSEWEERLLRRHAMHLIGRNEETPSQLGSRVTMLFLATAAEGRISDAGATQLVYLLQQSPLRESITTGAHHDTIRRLLSAWVLHCPNNGHEILKQRLDIASIHNLREALPLALAVSHGDPEYITVPPAIKATAVLLVGQFGGSEHVAHLEPLLEDDSLCSVVRGVPAGGNPNGVIAPANVEVRDVALATMLHLTRQDPTAYGFTNVMRQPSGLYNPSTLYLENAEKRQAAAEKWRAWRSQESRAERGEPSADAAKSSS